VGAAVTNPTVSELLSDSLRRLQNIGRAEIRLVLVQLLQAILDRRAALVSTVAGLLCGLLALGAFSVAAFFGIAYYLPDWAASLIVAAALLLMAVGGFSLGWRQLTRSILKSSKSLEIRQWKTPSAS
jgi:hypothetical protein